MGLRASGSSPICKHASPAGLQSQMFWELIFMVHYPWAGSREVGLRPLLPWGEPPQLSLSSCLWVTHPLPPIPLYPPSLCLGCHGLSLPWTTQEAGPGHSDQVLTWFSFPAKAQGRWVVVKVRKECLLTSATLAGGGRAVRMRACPTVTKLAPQGARHPFSLCLSLRIYW